MAQTNVKVEQEGSDLGAVAGGVVTGTTAAAVTFAGATKVAHTMQETDVSVWKAVQETAVDVFKKTGEGLQVATDFVKENLGKAKDGLDAATKATKNVNATDAVEAVNNPEAIKEGANQIKNKAGAVFDSLKGGATDLWHKFDDIKDARIKAAIVAATVTTAIVGTALATNALSPETEVQVKSQDTHIAAESKGATKIQSKEGELTFG